MEKKNHFVNQQTKFRQRGGKKETKVNQMTNSEFSSKHFWFSTCDFNLSHLNISSINVCDGTRVFVFISGGKLVTFLPAATSIRMLTCPSNPGLAPACRKSLIIPLRKEPLLRLRLSVCTQSLVSPWVVLFNIWLRLRTTTPPQPAGALFLSRRAALSSGKSKQTPGARI